VTLGGVDLPEGAKLFLWLASTGRDAAMFPDPDVFDMTRANAGPRISFRGPMELWATGGDLR
jgi:cytochrome P450